MSWVAVAIGGAKAMGQYQQGQSAKATGQAQGKALDYEGQQVEQASLDQAAIIRRQGRYAVGAANTAYAASGVKVGEGSAADVTDQMQTDIEHDAYTAILNGTKRANQLRATGTMSRAQGDAAAAQANLQATATVMGAAYTGMQNSGWRTAGPGFSGTQSPAPITDRSIRIGG
jgi:hypothetical protein